MYDYPPLDRMNVQRPTRHGMLLLAFPNEQVAAEILRRTQLFRHRCGLSGRPLLPDRFHVTLCDLGEHPERPDTLVAQVSRAASTITSPPVTVTFDRLLSFKRNANAQPLVLSGSDGLAELHRFRQKLILALIEVGLEKKFARPSFTPHMTLLYDPCTIKPRAIDPVRWTMTEFVLVDSLRGQTKHVPIARWQLRGEPNG
jgi:RNA 2',3'-cyclic 3'-phosphodiesterase